MRDLAQIKILDSDDQGPAQEIDLLPQRRPDMCVSVRCRIGSLYHSGMVVVWFGFNALLTPHLWVRCSGQSNGILSTSLLVAARHRVLNPVRLVT